MWASEERETQRRAKEFLEWIQILLVLFFIIICNIKYDKDKMNISCANSLNKESPSGSKWRIKMWKPAKKILSTWLALCPRLVSADADGCKISEYNWPPQTRSTRFINEPQHILLSRHISGNFRVFILISAPCYLANMNLSSFEATTHQGRFFLSTAASPPGQSEKKLLEACINSTSFFISYSSIARPNSILMVFLPSVTIWFLEWFARESRTRKINKGTTREERGKQLKIQYF